MTISETMAETIARAIGESLFSSSGNYPKDTAQSNLNGKTPYANDGTLRYFFSRIVSTRTTDHGLVFMLIESTAADYQNRSRGFRFVAFDLFGKVINDRACANTEELISTSAKCEKAMWAWVNNFDTLSHYKTAMAETTARLNRQTNDLLACVESL